VIVCSSSSQKTRRKVLPNFVPFFSAFIIFAFGTTKLEEREGKIIRKKEEKAN
jgi:hypothetical protein